MRDCWAFSGSLALWQADATLPSIAWLHALWWRGITALPVAPTISAARREALTRRFEPALSVGGRSADIEAACMPPFADRASLPPDPRGPSTLMLTSGSGGAPKAVPLSPRHHEASVAAIRERLQFDCRDRWLLCLPLDHIGGLAILIRAAHVGGTVVVHGRFDPDAILATCRSQPVTLMSVVPTMLRRLVRRISERTDGRLDSGLRAVLVGGAPLNEEFGRAIGADAYCRDAAVAVETAQAFMARRQGSAAALEAQRFATVAAE